MDCLNSVFGERNKDFVNWAEVYCERYFEKLGSIVKIGIDDPGNVKFSKGAVFGMPKFLLKMPDFLYVNKEDECFLIEVKSVGSESGVLRLKESDLVWYRKWDSLCGNCLWFFVYDFGLKKAYFFSLKDLEKKLEGAVKGVFPDSCKVFFEVSRGVLSGD